MSFNSVITREKDRSGFEFGFHYPETFYSFANAVVIKEDEINKWVKECVSQLDKDTDYTLSASGDTIVFAYKSDWDDSIASVVVAKKYQECDVKIPRENF